MNDDDGDDDYDDDNNDNDDDELILWSAWLTKSVKPYFRPGPLSDLPNIANLQHVTNRI